MALAGLYLSALGSLLGLALVVGVASALVDTRG